MLAACRRINARAATVAVRHCTRVLSTAADTDKVLNPVYASAPSPLQEFS